MGRAVARSFLFVLLAAAGVWAQTAASSDQHSDGQRKVKTDPNYRIGVGDVLRVRVSKNELLSLDGVRVGNAGTIRLPMLTEDIPAVCRTEAELSEEVTRRYRKYIHEPQVYVAVMEYNANPVAIVGAVVTPGRFQLQRPMRLLEVLASVNGTTANAGRNVQIIRNPRIQDCEQNEPLESLPEEDQVLISVPLAETMKGVDTANPLIRSGDIISISEAEQAFIIGNVRSAVAIKLREPVTISKAIAIAGGVTPDANQEKVKLSREGQPPIFVNLKEIAKQKQEDIVLKPNDILEVPGPSGTKKFLKDIFKTIIPSIARAPLLIP